MPQWHFSHDLEEIRSGPRDSSLRYANAMVYGTGFIKLKDLVRVGFLLDILSWLFTVGILLIFGWLIFGVFSL